MDFTQTRNRAVAPTRLPGVVLYAPNSLKSTALLDFASELRARRWRVGGVIIDTLYDDAGQKIGLDLIDLLGERRLPFARSDTSGIAIGRWVLDPATLAEGDRIIQDAVAKEAELVIVDKFGPLESGGDGGFAAGLKAALAARSALLVAVRGEFLDGWDDFADRPTTMLRAEPSALWRWWGPYRIYEELIRGVPEVPVSRIVIGTNWTLVEGPDGCGLAHSPARDSPGCRPLCHAGEYAAHGLQSLARLAHSWNPFEAAIGLAAINAHYNRRDLEGVAENGLDLLAAVPGKKIVVGRFPELAKRIPGAAVLERVPGPDDFPSHASDWIMGAANAVAITASAFGNLTLPHLLELSAHAKVALVGPGTPLDPRLHAYGITWLSGFVVEDAERAARVVAEGGATKALKGCGRLVTLAAEPPAASKPREFSQAGSRTR